MKAAANLRGSNAIRVESPVDSQTPEPSKTRRTYIASSPRRSSYRDGTTKAFTGLNPLRMDLDEGRQGADLRREFDENCRRSSAGGASNPATHSDKRGCSTIPAEAFDEQRFLI